MYKEGAKLIYVTRAKNLQPIYITSHSVPGMLLFMSSVHLYKHDILDCIGFFLDFSKTVTENNQFFLIGSGGYCDVTHSKLDDPNGFG